MYKSSPQVPLISPYKRLSPSLIFTTFFTVYTQYSLCRSLTLTHMHILFILSYAHVSSCCNELSILAQEAVTEVFIKHTAIHKVPRTGKSHSSKASPWNRREGNKLGFGYPAALDDKLCHGLVLVFCDPCEDKTGPRKKRKKKRLEMQ